MSKESKALSRLDFEVDPFDAKLTAKVVKELRKVGSPLAETYQSIVDGIVKRGKRKAK